MEAKRTSVGDESLWDVQLELEENRLGFFSEMGVNGLSADKIAEMRARFILLNERLTPTRKPEHPLNLNDSILDVLVSGLNSRVKVEGSVLPIYGEL